jgi:hypothetical protein
MSKDSVVGLSTIGNNLGTTFQQQRDAPTCKIQRFRTTFGQQPDPLNCKFRLFRQQPDTSKCKFRDLNVINSEIQNNLLGNSWIHPNVNYSDIRNNLESLCSAG